MLPELSASAAANAQKVTHPIQSAAVRGNRARADEDAASSAAVVVHGLWRKSWRVWQSQLLT
jgi:hypothetical protein